jgi:type IV pilus assembly protein PilV
MSHRRFHRSALKRSREARRRRGGFTLIEVMMALAVMTVGAMGIMALQQATTRGNRQARHMTKATQVTRLWLERARRDALLWNTGSAAGLRTANGPLYLSAIPDPGAGASAWFAPYDETNAPDQSYGFDYQGNDTTTADEMRYCTHLKLEWAEPGDTIRVEARTFWHRGDQGSQDATFSDRRLFSDCGRGDEATVTAELAAVPSRLRAVSASTVVRWTALQ